ncbi:aromatic compound dioxygenase [Cytidiella melzeri]|nr:aromatic compound dioxygenase [Cytidiella melzeri]
MAQDFAPAHAITFRHKLFSTARLIYRNTTTDNPLVWSWWRGRQHPAADLEGPYYVTGSPERRLEDGRVILANAAELMEDTPFLLVLHIRGPSGEPVKNTEFDWWQANGKGVYNNVTYNLRGKFQSDEHGDVEILSIIPGKYGPEKYIRAGHFHFIVSDPANKHRPLTTQQYVCRANDSAEMDADFLNFVRSRRPGNMLQSWAASDEKCMELPPLSPEKREMVTKVAWWNTKMAELNVNATVVAGAETTIKLNAYA